AAISRRSRMMYRALQTMARVSATCAAISRGAVLARSMAERMGRISMTLSSLALELQGGDDLAGAPGGQQAGGQRGQHRQDDGDGQHRNVEPGHQLQACVELADPGQGTGGQGGAGTGTDQADHAGFGQVLGEDLATAGTEGAAHADLARAGAEL